MSITFVTGNPMKIALAKKYLAHPFTHRKIELEELQSLDLHTIVEHKARQAFEMVKTPVLVEDTALTFHALGNLPGPLVRWFLEEIGTKGMCQMLNGFNDPSALAEVSFCLFNGTTPHFFDGARIGSIAPIPRGDKGFGWDAVFIPEGQTKTWAEMDFDEQHTTSIRAEAFAKLKMFLSQNKTL